MRRTSEMSLRRKGARPRCSGGNGLTGASGGGAQGGGLDWPTRGREARRGLGDGLLLSIGEREREESERE